MTDKQFAAPREEPEKAREQLQALRDEFYAALIVMRNYYGGAISRAAIDEQLERGLKFIKQTDDVLALSTPSPVSPCEECVSWELAFNEERQEKFYQVQRADKLEAELAALRPSAAPVSEGSR